MLPNANGIRVLAVKRFPKYICENSW